MKLPSTIQGERLSGGQWMLHPGRAAYRYATPRYVAKRTFKGPETWTSNVAPLRETLSSCSALVASRTVSCGDPFKGRNTT